MTPAMYIEKFCRVTDRRRALYKKIFDKNKLKTDDNEEYLDLPVRRQLIIYILNKPTKKTKSE